MTKNPFFLFIIFLAGCTPTPSVNNKPGIASDASWTPPPAGTIVAADSMKVDDESSGNTYFSVRMSVGKGNSGKQRDGFKYNVHATRGNAVTDGEIVMPFGGEHMKPLLRRGEGYTYIMGFIPGDVNGDHAFHEYYRIAGAKDYIRITPLEGYKVEE